MITIWILILNSRIAATGDLLCYTRNRGQSASVFAHQQVREWSFSIMRILSSFFPSERRTCSHFFSVSVTRITPCRGRTGWRAAAQCPYLWRATEADKGSRDRMGWIEGDDARQRGREREWDGTVHGKRKRERERQAGPDQYHGQPRTNA